MKFFSLAILLTTGNSIDDGQRNPVVPLESYQGLNNYIATTISSKSLKLEISPSFATIALLDCGELCTYSSEGSSSFRLLSDAINTVSKL
jgi:hypothetical protein